MSKIKIMEVPLHNEVGQLVGTCSINTSKINWFAETGSSVYELQMIRVKKVGNELCLEELKGIAKI